MLRLLSSALIALMCVAPLSAQAQEALSPAEKAAVQAEIRKFLEEHPDEVMDALMALQTKELAARRAKQMEQLNGTEGDPIMGNPDGDVTVVEFFDYRCTYCKKVFPDVQTLLKEDGNIRYVLKELPILGPDSVTATKAALAVWAIQPEAYPAFHSALMTMRGSPTLDRVMDIAKDLDIDLDELTAAMDSRIVRLTIAKTKSLAAEMNIDGTPAFVIGNAVLPGAIDLETMRKQVAEARLSN